MKVLLDANVLIALSIADHVHHDYAEMWLSGLTPSFKIATCPITQGALVRMLLRSGVSAMDAQGVITAWETDARFEFWQDTLPYPRVDMAGVIGHRQVTDAYLAALAREHGARLATFDRGLAALYSDVGELVATSH